MTGLPLADLRVVELGQLLAGPFCGQLLGDFGAEVIKVEDPGRGDPMREWGREKPLRQVAVVAGRGPQQEVGHLQPARRRRARTLVRRLIDTADVAGGELPARAPWSAGAWHPRQLWQINPRPDHHPGHRLRPDRAVRAARRLRLDRRGDGRHPLRHRRSRPAAGPGRDLARRLAGRHVRLPRHPGRAAQRGTAPAAARWWTRRSTRPCWR